MDRCGSSGLNSGLGAIISKAIEDREHPRQRLFQGQVSYNARGRSSFSWVDTEHWISTTEASIVRTAWDLWQLYTDSEDFDGAVWAAQRGLLASPTNTELTNCLLRAYAGRGDRGTAERLYRSHVRPLDRLELGEPEDSTVELWDELAEQSLDPGSR